MWSTPRTCDNDLLTWRHFTGTPITKVYRNWVANYLGTINNLEQVVTKTAAQTMKIVYTLTDINDESEQGG